MIEVRSLSCGFEQPVLEGLNLTFLGNEIVAILGPNGAGKSCFLQTLAGVIPPIKGEIAGIVREPRLRSMQLSYAAQEAIQPVSMKVSEYFDLVIPLDLEHRNYIVEQMEVTEYLDRSLSKLSGGERQRVRLVATLIQNAKFYLLDEPTNSLDPRPTENLLKVIKKLYLAQKSFFLVSHDLNLSLQMATRFIGFKNGSILFDCNLPELKQKDYLDQLFDKSFQWFEAKGDSCLVL